MTQKTFLNENLKPTSNLSVSQKYSTALNPKEKLLIKILYDVNS